MGRREAELEQARCAWLLACDLASAAFGADVRLVLQTSGKVGRGSDDITSKARKVACYLGLVVANVACMRLAAAADVDRATINKHAAWVEDRRDDPEFDAQVQALEDAMIRMALRIVWAKYGERAPEAAA